MKPKSLVLAMVTLLVSSNLAVAAGPIHTEIAVEKMHCANCAKKIAAQLYAVRGVKEVRVDVAKKMLYVVPASSATPSPRALWIAVENAKDVPVRLAGPSGTFSTRPQF